MLPLRKGHANLLRVVPVVVRVLPKREPYSFFFFFKSISFILILCRVCVLPVCMSTHLVPALPMEVGREGIRSLGPGVTGGCEPPCGVLRTDPGPKEVAPFTISLALAFVVCCF